MERWRLHAIPFVVLTLGIPGFDDEPFLGDNGCQENRLSLEGVTGGIRLHHLRVFENLARGDNLRGTLDFGISGSRVLPQSSWEWPLPNEE